MTLYMRTQKRKILKMEIVTSTSDVTNIFCGCGMYTVYTHIKTDMSNLDSFSTLGAPRECADCGGFVNWPLQSAVLSLYPLCNSMHNCSRSSAL